MREEKGERMKDCQLGKARMSYRVVKTICDTDAKSWEH
jgi:hypothetical protein